MAILMTLILVAVMQNQAGGAPRTMKMIVIMILFASIIRSGMHVASGYRISTRCMGLQQTTKNYLFISGGHVLAMLVLLKISKESSAIPSDVFLGMIVMFMGWPVALWWLSQSAIIKNTWLKSEEAGDPPVPRDLGVEGTGMVLVFFAIMGLCLGIYVLYMLTGSPLGKRLGHLGFSHKLLVGGVAIAVGRSAVQLQAGVLALNGGTYRKIFDKIRLYYILGWASSLGVVVGYFMLIQKQHGRYGGSIGGMGLAFLFLLGCVMIAWPMIVGSHFKWIQLSMAALDIDEDEQRRTSTDGGWTTLGYFIFSLGALTMSMVLGGLIMGAPLPDKNVMMVLVSGGAALWAGWELIHLSANAQMAATVYGAIGCLLGLYNVSKTMESLTQLGTDVRDGLPFVLLLVFLVASLAGPVLTLYVVHRPQAKEQA
jgi:hypothetical protein